MDDSLYIIDRQTWTQAAIQTAERTRDFVAGRSPEPADEWAATSEPDPKGGYKIQVSGPVATADLWCCTNPKHWPTHKRLAKMITEPRPKRANRWQRMIHKLR